jgi:hypothetical protein
MVETILDIETWMLAVGWIFPIGFTVYLWRVYFRVGRKWLLQLFCITATLVDVVILYFSFLVILRLMGIPALGFAPFSGLVVILLYTIPVYKGIRVWQAEHGTIEPPEVPTNGHKHERPTKT